MNQNVRVGRLAIGALCASIGLGMSHPAHAGTWEFTKTSSGTNVSPSNDYPTWEQDPGQVYGSSPISTSGTFNYHCKWTPASNSETIPKGLRVPVYGSVSVIGNPYVDPTGGLSIAEKAASGPTKEGFNTYTWSLDVTVLAPIPGGGESSNGQVKEFDISFPASASCTSSGYGGRVYVDVLEPVEDDRSVKLTRNSLDRFSQSGGNWTTYGKTCYSNAVVSPTSDPGEVHNSGQDFTANLEGEWSSIVTVPTVTWNWSAGSPLTPAVLADTKYHAGRIAPTGGLTWTRSYDTNGGSIVAHDQWSGTGINSQTATITYDVTDQGDGATRTATYVLEIHEPIEKVLDDHFPVWAYCPIWGSHPLPGNPNGVLQPNGPIVAGSSTNPTVSVGHSESQGVSYTVAGDLGFDEVSSTLGFSASWSSEQSRSVDQSQAVDINVGENYFTYPMFEDKYIRHCVSYRHFTEAGEHELAPFENPPGSGLYDTPLHEVDFDEPSGGSIVWAEPQRIADGQVPNFTTMPAVPTPHRSGGHS